MPPTAAPSRSHQDWQVTTRGRTITGWSLVETADHDVPIGRYTPGAAKGDRVYAGRAAQGATHTLTTEYDPDVHRHLHANRGRRGSMSGWLLDEDDRKLSSLGAFTGRIQGVTASGKDASSGDPTLLVLRFAADGEITL